MTEPRLPKLGPQATPYVYRDAEGNAVFLAVRIDKPEGKAFAQYHVENGKWVSGGLQGKPLWNLPLIANTPDAKILVVEGEKAAKAAQNYLPDGWIVTTWAGGSMSTGATDWTPLQNRQVAIWPDWDLKRYQKGHAKVGETMPQDKQPGMMAAQRVASAVPGAKIIPLPVAVMASNFDGWDLADALPQGLTAEHVTAIIGNTFAEKAKEISKAAPTQPVQEILEPPTRAPTQSEIRELAELDGITYAVRRKQAAKAMGIPAGALDKAVASIRRNERKKNEGPQELITTDTGVIQPVFANVVTLLKTTGLSWGLGYDLFSNRIYTGDELLEDKHILAVAEWVQRQGCLATIAVVTDAINHIARTRSFHQVLDYLNPLKWDGEKRLDSMLVDYAGAADSELIRAQGAKFLIQAVARLYEPGCQADATLVFEGPQGLGKSSFFRVLFTDKWFTDHLPELTNKDALLQLRGVWCVEIAELATFTRADAKKINQFLTSRIDRYRDPYGRLVADYPRQNVFAGTVNPGAGGYLKDETGARRFWSIAVAADSSMDLGLLADDRDQLWAEAKERYQDGETWYLNNTALAAQAADAQADRYVGDPWQEAIEAFIANRRETTFHEIMVDCLNIASKGDWAPRESSRIAACLAHAGWEKYRRPRDLRGNRTWAYRRLEKPSEIGIEIPVDNITTIDNSDAADSAYQE